MKKEKSEIERIITEKDYDIYDNRIYAFFKENDSYSRMDITNKVKQYYGNVINWRALLKNE